MQRSSSNLSKSREVAEPNPLVPSMDPELENKISSILNRMPHHLKASAGQKNINQPKTTLSEILQHGPFTRSVPLQFNALVKHNELLFKSQLVQPESQQPEEKTANDLKSPTSSNLDFQAASGQKSLDATQLVEKATSLRDYQEVLNQRVENALRRSQAITRGVHQPSVTQRVITIPNQPEKQPQSPVPFQFDSEKLNSRVEEAMKRSELNLKRSGVYDSKIKPGSPHQPNMNDYAFLSPQTKHVQNYYADISAIESKYKSLSSPQNFLKTSAGRGNLDSAFNEALKRSEALLKQNQVGSKEPVMSTKQTEIKTSNLYNSLVQEKFTNSTGFLHKTPSKEKNLHIFQNAIKTMSPAGIYSPQHDIKPLFTTEEYEDGSSYNGEVLNGKKHGRGILQYADGSKYEGEWEDGEKSGYGTQTQPDGDVLYEGEWSNGKYHGSGILFNPAVEKNEEAFDYSSFSSLGNNWEKYEGEFEYGRWHGLGTLHLRNGEKFVGKFRNGQVHGKGTFYQSNGKMVTGEWQEDKFAGAL